MVKKDEEADIRGINQKGMAYDNTCVLFGLVVLEKYLHVKFDTRFALRNFKNGIKGEILDEILDRSKLRYQSHYNIDHSEIEKQDVRKILERASAELNCGVIIVQYDKGLNHLVAFYPVIVDEHTNGIRVIDCRGDISQTIMEDNVHVMTIIECLDAPRVIPKELRGGGGRKTKKKRSSKKKTHGRRV